MSSYYINIVPIEKTEVERAAEGRAAEVDVVQAEPNPFPAESGPEVTLQPGDTVTWNLPPNRKMRVEFQAVQDLPVDSNPFKESNSNGPFKSLSAENGRIVGTVADLPEGPSGKRRFYYTLLEEGRNIEWDKKPPGAPSERVGGGIDVPKKPPGGGGDG